MCGEQFFVGVDIAWLVGYYYFMSKKRTSKRTSSLRLRPQSRNLLEQLLVALTARRGRRVTMTDILEEAVVAMAKKEGIVSTSGR